MAFIDNFDVILLDQGRTFMFELDRFGPAEDYYVVYASLGGKKLDRDRVQYLLVTVLDRLRSAYNDPARYDDIPTADEIITQLSPDVSPSDRQRLADVIGIQEVGTISAAHAATIRALSETHQLGIVSNVWGASHFFEDNLSRHEILDCFDVRIWSSDHRCVKPSHRLFEHALRHFDVPSDRIVYVGDDPMRDVPPSKELGMGAVWIDHGNRDRPTVSPDLVLSDLSNLIDA